MTSFWLNDPSVLLNKDQITEIWPSGSNSLERKLNSITRIVILLGFLGFLITRSIRIPVSALITLVIIVIMYNVQTKKDKKKHLSETISKEGFTSPSFYKMKKNDFKAPTKQNPLGNVTLPEIKYNPKRKSAPPSFNPQVEKKINEKAGNVGINPKLFRDLGDKLDFENSMRQFHSMPNTKIPNDQEAFAKFCYGDMPSCKEGDGLQCVKDNSRWINY
jgi:hypothetical protein|tara:strand:- start:2435 stop:3088 length:654 start_codon:yes stop_codon:yes gene_type:complete